LIAQLINLCLIAVYGRIIRRRVRPIPPDDRFDQGRPFPEPSPFERFFYRKMDRKYIHPVDANSRNSISDRFLSDCFGVHLLFDRNRYRIAVVLVEKDDWRFKHASDVDAFMEIPFRCGTVSKISDCRIICPFIHFRHRCAGCVGQLCSNRNGSRENPFFKRGKCPFHPTCPIEQQTVDLPSESQGSSVVAISRKHPILVAKRQRTAYLGSLLPRSEEHTS